VRPPNDVRQQKCSDLLEVAARGKLCGHLAAAVAAVGIAPNFDGFFTIDKKAIQTAYLPCLRAEQTRQLQHHAGGGTAVVGGRQNCRVFSCRNACRAESHPGFSPGIFTRMFFIGRRPTGVSAPKESVLHAASIAFLVRIADSPANARWPAEPEARGAETDLLDDLREGALAIEASGLFLVKVPHRRFAAERKLPR